MDKRDFPVLKRKINGKKLVYLDNAATSLTPKQVVSAMNEYYESYNANVHRGNHSMSQKASEKYDEAHETVGKFVNARSGELIFTKSTTESLNLLAYSLTQSFGKGGNVVVSEMEHHSNFVPWQQLAIQKGFELRIAPTKRGVVDVGVVQELVDEKTKVVSLVHASNVLGGVNPVKKISKIVHEKGALLVLDAAQSVTHMPVDVKDLGADFIAFSAHKMMGPTGIGALWGKKELLEKMVPFNYGGDMIKEVTKSKTTFNDLPWKFEAGTPDIAGGVGFAAAVKYLENIGMEKVFKHSKVMGEALAGIIEDQGGKVYGPMERIGLASFNFPQVHPHDLALFLDNEGVAVRSGHNCAMPLMKSLKTGGVCRASSHVYNDDKDLESFSEALQKALKVLK